MNKAVSAKQSFLYAVHELVEHPWYYIKYMLIVWGGWYAISFVLNLSMITFIIPILSNYAQLSLIPTAAMAVNMGMLLLLYLLATVVWPFLLFGSIKLMLHIKDHETKHSPLSIIFSLFGDPALLLRLFLFSWLFGICVMLSMILIIPGFYLLVKGIFTPYIMIDEHMGAWQAFKKSCALTKGNFWPVLAIILIGSFAWQIFLIPMALLMMAFAYRKLEPK